jgi:hypothetical protein
MFFHEVTIYHLLTGWNGVYPNSMTDVDSDLGPFTWRRKGSALVLPVNHTIIVSIDLDSDVQPQDTIAQAIINTFEVQSDNLAAHEVAKQLVEDILFARKENIDPASDN